VTGAALLVTTLAVSLLDRINLSKTFIYLGVGLLAGPLALDLSPEDPLDVLAVLERLAELGVILSLLVVGMRIGRPISWSGWRSTARLVLIVMPATIFLVALAGSWWFGLALGPAILLGAVLAPTDSILAGPLEERSPEDEAEERFGLSSESGLNDGFAFPFVYLGFYLTTQRQEWQDWLAYWLVVDLLYAVAIAPPLGFLLGWATGRSYLRLSAAGTVSNKRRQFVPLALLLAVYGFVEVIGAYGFLAAFTAGLGFRRALQQETEALTYFSDFTDSIDDLVKAAALIMIGALLRWSDFVDVGWGVVLFPLLFILLIRPGLTWLATVGGGFSSVARAYWAWFGIRGIGSIYYLSYALVRGVEGDVARLLFTLTVATILVSSLLHSFSMRPILHRLEPGQVVEE
jgi:sodium/hydrogen antiporter